MRKFRIVIGEGSCGIAAGARKLREAIEQAGHAAGVTGCIGMCYLEPIVDLYEGNALKARLVKVQEKDVGRIVEAAETGELTGVKDLVIAA